MTCIGPTAQYYLLGVDVEHASSASEPLVPAAKVDSSDAILTQHRGAHDTGLDSNVEVCVFQGADWMLGQDASQSNKLGVPRAIERAIRLVHTTTKHLAVLHKHATDWCFIALER